MAEQTRPSPRPRPRPRPQAPVGKTAPAPPATSPKSSRRNLVLIGLAALLVVGLVTLNVWLWLDRSHNDDAEKARSQALAAARVRVPGLLSYDYRKLDDYVRDAPKNATGTFKSDFSKLIAVAIAPAAKQQQITTKAVVKKAGVIDGGADQVTVLVLLDQTTTSKSSKNGSLDGSRDRVTLRKVDGSWLVSAFDPV